MSLADALPGLEVIGNEVVPLPKVRAGTLFGTGKIDELRASDEIFESYRGTIADDDFTVRASGAVGLTTGGLARLDVATSAIENVTLQNGYTAGNGGLIAFAGNSLTVSDSSLLNSNSDGSGGAIALASGILTLEASTIDNNNSDNHKR